MNRMLPIVAAVLCVVAHAQGAPTCGLVNGTVTGLDAATNECVPCADRACIECAADYQKCTQCAFRAAGPGMDAIMPFYLAPNASCLACDPDAELGCDTSQGCNPDGSCVACDLTYTRFIDGKCVRCPDGCAFGDNNSTGLCNEQAKCIACTEGYVLTEAGECVTCPEGCSTCDAKDPAVCLQCGDMYGSNGTACVPCADPSCADCRDDYSQCTNCTVSAWMAPDGSCQQLQDMCNAANAEGNCTECQFGYALVAGTCQACDPTVGGDCETCDPANLTVCLKCDSPYNTTVLRDGKCVPPCKDSNCAACPSPDSDTCDKCFNGYGLVDGRCIPCVDESYSFACDACDGNPEVCTRCAYARHGVNSLVNGSCVYVPFRPEPSMA